LIQELLLQALLESEAFGDAEGHGGDRDQGQQREKSQRRCPQGAMMPGKALNGKDGRSHQADQQPADGRWFATTGMPDGGGEKSDEAGRQRPDCYHETHPLLLY
jgi:hypothetical protein